jgi:hypothetical protein
MDFLNALDTILELGVKFISLIQGVVGLSSGS